MPDFRIKNAIRRNRLCPMCGGMKEPAEGQQKCSGIMYCKYIKAMGLEIKKIGGASPVRPDGAAPAKDEGEQAGATPAGSGIEDADSVRSEGTPEDWVINDAPLGVE